MIEKKKGKSWKKLCSYAVMESAGERVNCEWHILLICHLFLPAYFFNINPHF